MTDPANRATRYARDADVIAQASGGCTVLFHMENGRYFSLNECAARIWELCDGTRTPAEIAATLKDEYAVPAAIVEDVSEVIAAMSASGLVQTIGD